MYLGTFIKNQRIMIGKTQKEIATSLGIKRQAVSRWENNLALPTLEHLCRISDLLEIPLNELLRALQQSLKSEKGCV